MSKPLRVIVCGGRDYLDADRVVAELSKLKPDLVIHGGAPGADRLAGAWAEINNVPMRVVFADWDHHGRAAGPIRNQKMIDDHSPDMVLAFPGGRGTADMVRRAKAAGIPVKEIV